MNALFKKPLKNKVIQNVKFVKCGSKIGRYGTLQ